VVPHEPGAVPADVQAWRLLMAGIVDSIRWHKSRMAAMSVPELGYRMTELIARFSGRRMNREWSEIPAKGNIAELPSVRRAYDEMPAELKVRVVEQARSIIAGKFELLGASWTQTCEMPPAPGFWHLDAAGVPWSSPRDYCFDIPYRARAGREVKHVWEINRLQFLIPLAVYARLTGDTHAGRLVLRILFSWMQGNRPYRGINWVAGVELALRVISVAIALSIIGLQGVGRTELIHIERFFSVHLLWLRRYPSLHSSQNNHRIAELAGSLICMAFAPGIDDESILKRDLAQLMVQLECQILRDGVGAEQSPTYAAFSLELALIALMSLNIAPDRLPPLVRERLLAWINHIDWMSSPAGHVARIGDSDDGAVVVLGGSAGPLYVVSIAKFVKRYLTDPGLPQPRRFIDMRDTIFFSPPACSSPTTTTPLVGVRTWDVGGYTVWRQRPSSPIVLAFDHGPLGYLSIAAHGHADALSIWLSVGDTPVIVDAGTYVYNADPIWRERFRSSMLHNTLSIAGISSSSVSGPFNWATKANAHIASGSSSRTDEVVAEHDGYLKRFGVRHRRSVSMSTEGKISIADELIGRSAPPPVQISFLVNPDLAVRIDDSRDNCIVVEKSGRPLVEFSHQGELKAHIALGDAGSGRGWVSPSFGKLTAAPQIVFEGHLSKKSMIKITPLD
jgi:heparinase II/III-like protein